MKAIVDSEAGTIVAIVDDAAGGEGYDMTGCALVTVPAELEDAARGGWALQVVGDTLALAETTPLGNLRARRDLLLYATDPTRWMPMDEPERSAWADYQQALRDWPETETDLLAPTEPAAPDPAMLNRMVDALTRVVATLSL